MSLAISISETRERRSDSGMIRGIGPVYAKKLVRAFSDKVFDIIEGESARLREVAGIGPVRARRITGRQALSRARFRCQKPLPRNRYSLLHLSPVRRMPM